ncbi:MAG TPA: hypothetical protein PLK12_01385 [Prolixibacteraceae bacterium]|nr:hypothetical protein [Prolixibacteraceae bacterium]
MELLKVMIIAAVLLLLALLGLAVQILFHRNHRFPNTHVGGNRNMKKKGITCAQTWDKVEQRNAEREQRFKNLQLIRDEEA